MRENSCIFQALKIELSPDETCAFIQEDLLVVAPVGASVFESRFCKSTSSSSLFRGVATNKGLERD